MKIKTLFALLFLTGSPVILSGPQTGTVILETIPAPSLANSVLGEPDQQPVAVYLPPSYYKETEKRYPVIYFLPGYEDTLAAYLKGYIGGYYFKKSMNSNITQGRMKEVIMVMVNGFNILEGSFFQNSPVTGNWEDFVIRDVVNYIDANYRTLPNADSRALVGLSMGGYGALHLSMRHPSVFSVGVGECPGLANESGMMKTSLFNDTVLIHNIITIRDYLNALPEEEARQKYLDTVANFRAHGNWLPLFTFAYGSAFAPDTSARAPYFDYPFTTDENGWLVKDTAIFKTYELGFGDLKHKIEIYKDSLLKLKGYGIDYGTNDFFQWIPEGCIYYDSLLTANEIPHRLWVNSGGHGNLHKSRTENFELPYCDSILAFDTLHLSNEAGIDRFTCSGQLSEGIIDTVNHVVHISFKSSANLKAVIPSIFVSPGAGISPSQGSTLDLSGGSFTYTITSESDKVSVDWIIVASVSGIQTTKQEESKIHIFPNPASSFFVVEAENIIRKIEIRDITGHIMITDYPDSRETRLDSSSFSSGIYFVAIFYKNDCIVQKLIIR